MHWRFVVANGLVLGGIGWIVASATETSAAGVLARPEAGVGDLGGLEARAALSPTPTAVAELATAYLEREQPGLASAAIERAPAAVRSRPELGQLRVRVLLREGRAHEALGVARQ